MKTPKSRDGNILKSYKREISLRTTSIKDKTKYSRVQKHQFDYFDMFCDVSDVDGVDEEEYLKCE